MDTDQDGTCDLHDRDDDDDGVVDPDDAAPLDPASCQDADADGCDDCSRGIADPADDGTDTDGDGACDEGDQDDDNDGVADTVDPAPFDDRVLGRVFFVAGNDPRASDDNDGLVPVSQGERAGPWRTVAHAASLMGPGDTTFILPAIYSEAEIVFANSGLEGFPITLSRRASDESPVIDGADLPGTEHGIRIGAGQNHYVIEGLTIRNMAVSGIATTGGAALHQGLAIRDCTLHHNGRLSDYGSGIDLVGVEGAL